ncbi:hypothetical protein K2173_023760 [Erythroxylum novogranatense]|uniref:Cytochrome P450 n=1 Tax=Erythroxylum novogranatense TaxID=1862640 RepID=A0AAV8TID2_9ROSI|nr:hypothetical protein K2173_023760 [Erythroxylum novogranatense]
MEFQPLSLHLLFISILFLLMLGQIVKRSKGNKPARKLPPGPWRLPILGNLLQLVGSLPHRRLRDLAGIYGPLMHLQLGEVPTLVVSSPETAKEVMKTHDVIFSNRPKFLAPRIISYDCKNIIFSHYGGYWRQLRKICTIELLSAKRVQSFRRIREEEMSNLNKILYSSRGSTINLSEKIHSLTYGITARAAFGKKCKDQEAFISIITRLIEIAAGFSVADVYPSIEALSGLKRKLEKIHQQSDRILENIINEHKVRGRIIGGCSEELEEDLVDVLLKLQDSDPEFPLSVNSIKAVILDIFSAGSETSATTVEWAMSEMLKNPEVMERAQTEVREVFNRKGNVDETDINELKFLKSVIKETLRLHPPLPLIPRECTENCTINGYDIPANTRVFINVWAIGRDPLNWNEAEKFKPERFLNCSTDFKGSDFEYIPFGGGRRMCPGITFGMANIELPLAQLLYLFDWELPFGMKHKELDMTETSGATIRRKELMLIPTPYRPLDT